LGTPIFREREQLFFFSAFYRTMFNHPSCIPHLLSRSYSLFCSSFLLAPLTLCISHLSLCFSTSTTSCLFYSSLSVLRPASEAYTEVSLSRRSSGYASRRLDLRISF
jgi:hypothetical protein